MKRIVQAALAAVFLTIAGLPASAQDAFGVCESSATQCDALAVEVRKLQLAEELRISIPAINPSFLCPENNPECCPPHLMPVCMAHGQFVVEHTFATMKLTPDFGDCPWPPKICERMGAFYCGPDGGWNPWQGCTDPIVFPPIPEPPICPPGKVWNGKVCMPVPCKDPRFGVEVICSPIGPGLVAVDPSKVELFNQILKSDAVTDSVREAFKNQANIMIDGATR